MSELVDYTNAVAMRKVRSKFGIVNVAVLMELEQKDVPLLLEIIRVQDAALEKIETIIEEEAGDVATLARAKVEELASTGSKARWGEQNGN